MPVTTPCQSCFAAIDCPQDNPFSYSLTSGGGGPCTSLICPPECPPGFVCNIAFCFNCCGAFLSQAIPLPATVQQKAGVIQSLLNTCAALNPSCPTWAFNPLTQTLFYGAFGSCVLPCGDGVSNFNYTSSCQTIGFTNAGLQEQANQQAFKIAAQSQFCIQKGVLSTACLCVRAPANIEFGLVGPGASTPVGWSITSGTLPAGLSLKYLGGGAAIVGTPATPGFSDVVLKADSGTGLYTTKSLRITVLQITTATLPDYTVGVPYSFQLAATGGSGNYNWKIDSGSLPAGLTMSLTGLISGTPV